MGLAAVSTLTAFLVGGAHGFTQYVCPSSMYPSRKIAVDGSLALAEGICCQKQPTSCDDYKCPDGKEKKEYKFAGELGSNLQIFNDETCCVEATCGEGWPLVYLCGDAGMVPNTSADKSALRTTKNCCKPWVSSCAYYTKFVPPLVMDLFQCPEGKRLKGENLLASDPSEKTCCETFAPTCETPNIRLNQFKSFKCPSGRTPFVSEKNNALPATEANCCKDYVATCLNAKDDGSDGDIYQCPVGTVIVHQEITEPNKEKCCTKPKCEISAMQNCSELGDKYCKSTEFKMLGGSGELDPTKADQQFIEKDWCCKLAVPEQVVTTNLKITFQAELTPQAEADVKNVFCKKTAVALSTTMDKLSCSITKVSVAYTVKAVATVAGDSVLSSTDKAALTASIVADPKVTAANGGTELTSSDVTLKTIVTELEPESSAAAAPPLLFAAACAAYTAFLV